MPARGSRHKKAPRGGQPQNVVKRGHRSSDKRVRQKANSEADGRRKAALEQVAADRERLERRIAHEAANPTVGRVSGAAWAARQQELADEEARAELTTNGATNPTAPAKPKVTLPPHDAQGKDWTMGQARSMLRAGYHIYHVQKATGWGAKWFDDMKVDPDGFGLPISD